MKRVLIWLLLLGVALGQVGCLRSQSVDESGYVLAIGFDEGDLFDYRISFAVQKIGMESNEPKTEGFSLHTAEAETLYEAIETLTGSLPHQLSFARTTMIILDLALVQERGRLEDLLNTAMERLLIRYNASVYVALDGANAVLEGLVNSDLKLSLDKLQSHFLDYAKRTGFLPLCNLKQLYETAVVQPGDSVIPLIGTSKGYLQIGVADSVGRRELAILGGHMPIETELQTGVGGAALLQEGQLAGVLDGQNTQLLLLATGQFQNGGMRFTDDSTGREYYFRVTPAGPPDVKLTLNETPQAQVRLQLGMSMVHPYRLEGETVETLESKAQDWLQTGLQRLFDTCQQLGTDAFGFEKQAVRQFTSVAAWERYDWRAAYQRLQASFTVSVSLDTDEKNAFLR